VKQYHTGKVSRPGGMLGPQPGMGRQGSKKPILTCLLRLQGGAEKIGFFPHLLIKVEMSAMPRGGNVTELKV